MGSTSPELSLDFKPAYVSTTITGFLTELKKIENVSEKLSKLDDYVMKLEEEMRKIDAFKRELPLCMLLLNDAIVALKEETTQCKIQPIMEEFIPSKKNTDEDGHGEMKKEKDCRDKKNWMSSVQLWTSNDFPSNRKQKQVMEMIEGDEEDDRTATENPFELCRYKNGGGAFMPFKGCSSFPASAGKKDKEEVSVPGLSLLIPRAKNPRSEGSSSSLKVKNNGTEGTVQSNLQLMNSHQQRKARRCWSPELHRRFVGALQQLGGSQAATPKQIRELMRVDGLTNDEVKSHLQKYRLHTRRVPVGAAAVHADQPVVVFRGLWMPQDQYGSSSKPSNSQSGSPQGPLQLAGTAGGVSTTGGDSMEEEEEDEKSESYSWKGHGHKGEEEDV